MSRFMDRLSGKNELTPEVRQVIADWANASRQLTQLLSLGSIIDPAERSLILGLLHASLDASTPTGVPVDGLFMLERHLKNDDERAQSYLEEVQRAQEVADELNARSEET